MGCILLSRRGNQKKFVFVLVKRKGRYTEEEQGRGEECEHFHPQMMELASLACSLLLPLTELSAQNSTTVWNIISAVYVKALLRCPSFLWLFSYSFQIDLLAYFNIIEPKTRSFGIVFGARKTATSASFPGLIRSI